MTTFSQLVDSVITQIGRPNLRTRAISIVNNLIYELHTTPQKGVILFDRNIQEESIVTTADNVYAWSTPKRFQKMLAVRFDSLFDYKGNYVYAQSVKPGRVMNDHKYYYYRNSGGHTMVGCGSAGNAISLAYYQRLAPLKYEAEGSRTATYEAATDTWTYTDPQPVDSTEEATRQAAVTNWMLMEHSAVLLEGALAALWKEAGDGRSQATYSRYQSLRDSMLVEENAVIL